MPARRTRIVATLGPASRDPAILDALLLAGVDVVRLNCSHSDPDALRADVRRVREASTRTGHPVAVLMDLQGPKIRTADIVPALDLPTGSLLTLVMADVPADGHRVGTTWPTLARDLTVGARVLFDDGALAATVTAIRCDLDPAEVDLRIDEGGRLSSHKGINVPGAALSAPALTPKDVEDLEAGLAADVDWVALSFVRRAADVDLLRGHLARLGRPDVPVCAKIEKPQALEDMDAILTRVEAIMVARGDLGVELDLPQVPVVQKRLIRAANRTGVLVITATQMLESMKDNPLPTRAEATDVCNAVLDGTDAVMLSGETAAGHHPVEAVRMMDRIVREAEASGFLPLPVLEHLPAGTGVGATVAHAACFAVRECPRPLVVFTWSGYTAIIASKSRPPLTVYALTPNEAVADRLSLAWGVVPVRIPEVTHAEDLLKVGEHALLERGFVAPGTEVVVLMGRTPSRGATNSLTVQVLG